MTDEISFSDFVAEIDKLMGGKPPAIFGRDAGAVIFTSGDKGTFMYLVLEGTLEIRVNDKIVEEVEPGGFFGEMALIRQAPRTATVTAKTDCRLIPIDRHRFLNWVRTKPEFALYVIKVMEDKMRQTNTRIAGW